MLPMRPPVRPSRLARLAGIAIALALPAAAQAGKETYVLTISKVELARKDTPAAVGSQVKAELGKAIEAHADLDAVLPADAPDPAARPVEFKAYLRKRKQRAFKVNVEVTDYQSSVQTRTGRPSALQVRVSLRIFGETVPDRVMAFTGEGSATVGVEIGKTLREKDQTYATTQALELAVADALEMAIKKLREPPPGQAKKKRR